MDNQVNYPIKKLRINTIFETNSFPTFNYIHRKKAIIIERRESKSSKLGWAESRATMGGNTSWMDVVQ